MRPLPLTVLFLAALLPDLAPAAPPIELSEMRARGRSGLGYSYWWGGGSWPGEGDEGEARECPGACVGVCNPDAAVMCTHHAASSLHGPRDASCEQWGADCSGYVAKVWVIEESYRDTRGRAHGPRAREYRADSSAWEGVEAADVRAGDVKASLGHVYFVDSVADDGQFGTMEAVGCSRGIVRQARGGAESGYVASRRSGLTEEEPLPVPGTPRGRVRLFLGEEADYCAEARDEQRDLGLRFVFTGPDEELAIDAAPTLGGAEACVTFRFGAAGAVRVTAQAFVPGADGLTPARLGPPSEALEVEVTPEVRPRPLSPVNGVRITDPRPELHFSAAEGPGSSQLRYDLEIHRGDPDALLLPGAAPLVKVSALVGRDAELRGDEVVFRLPGPLPASSGELRWRVRACAWSDCTPWSSAAGARGWGRFRVGVVEDGCSDRIVPPPSCHTVLAQARFECADGSTCAAGERCLFSVEGASCAPGCVTDADCGAGATCRQASGAAGGEAWLCVARPPAAESCGCDLTAAYESCDSPLPVSAGDPAAEAGSGGVPSANGPPPDVYLVEYRGCG